MKMDRKLTLLFSLLLILITLCNSIYAYNYNMELLHEKTFETLSALGNKMQGEVESYLDLMDYAVEELTTNVSFMNAMREATMSNITPSEAEQLEMQQLMYEALYSEPLMENFYRVSVYAPNGFFLSNHFEKTGSITSMSEEAKTVIAALGYLDDVDTSPSMAHIVPPHPDPWTTNSNKPIVFSSVKAVNWHGRPIGYIEVSSNIEELVRIFKVEEMPGLTAHVLFDDGTQLFRFFGDDAYYPNATDSDMTVYTLEDGSERFAIRLHSNATGLNVYVAQDISTYHTRSRQLLLEHLGVGSIILVIGIVLIILISKGLTRSIRSLTKKIKHVSSTKVVDHTTDLPLQSVTNPRDYEIFALEQTFNDLLMRLRRAAQREASLQNTTLQARFNALQTQINPHFVYNTLNIISAKGLESGSEEVMTLCDQFARMLRYATDVRSRSATLNEELQNALCYMTLVKARFEDQLEYHIDIPGDAEDLLIPKLTLQPLIENAINHGFDRQSGKRFIRLTGEILGDTLRIIIRDNGSGFDEALLRQMTDAFASIDSEDTPYADPIDGHIGLVNTYLRLHYYSRGSIRMSLYNEGGAVVELNLPCERSAKHV